MTKRKVRGTTLTDKLDATIGTPFGTTSDQQLQPQSIPRVFSKHGQRRPPTRAHPIPELDVSQSQILNKVGVLGSLGGSPHISPGLNCTSGLLDSSLRAANDYPLGSSGVNSPFHHVVGNASLAQTVVSASMPRVVSGAFSSQVVHSACNSLGMGIENMNTSGLHGISQKLGDEFGSIRTSSRSNVIIDSQGVTQSAQVGSQPSGDTSTVELATNTKKRGRGPSRGPNLKPELQLIIGFNEKMQPIGPNRTVFMKYLGKLARNGIRLPLTYEAWNDIPEDTLDVLWNDIKAIATRPPAYRTNCMKSLGEKWRSWKSVLKRAYFKGKSKEEALANVPTRVQPEQWKVLVEYWSLEKVKSVADQNKKNRAMHGPAHRTGRTPHAIIRQEMKENGLDTDQLSVYIKTRTDPNGIPKDDEAAIVIGQMKEKLSHIPTSEHTVEVKQRIFREVMGSECRGYVRTVGLGPSPSQYFGGTSPKHQLSDHYMTMIMNKVEEFYEQKYGGKISDMQAQIDNLNAKLQNSHQIPRSTNEPQQEKSLPQNVNNDDFDGLTMEEDINNEDFE